MNKTDEELNQAEKMAKRHGVRMCDENGDTHGEELYCVGIEDIADIIREALADHIADAGKVMLTTEQAQQIEETLVLLCKTHPEVNGGFIVNMALNNIRAARAQEDTVCGFSLWLDREAWGHVIDGLMLERERSAQRKAANPDSNSNIISDRCAELITQINDAGGAIRAARAQEQAEQEPVGRWNWNEAKFEWLTKFDYHKHHMTPLYAAPVQQVDLTDEEQLELARSSVGKSRHWLVAAVIAKLKEKNKC